MKKNILILFLATLLTNPLYSVTNYEDSDDFEYVPKETLIKFQQLQNENEELKAEIERLKKLHLEGIKIEEKEEKGKEPEEDTPAAAELKFKEEGQLKKEPWEEAHKQAEEEKRLRLIPGGKRRAEQEARLKAVKELTERMRKEEEKYEALKAKGKS